MGSTRLKSRRRHDQGFKWARIAIAILATIGVIDTGAITLSQWGLIGELSCIGGMDGCNTVLNSPWGTLLKGSNFSIPLSFAGFLGYSTILIMSTIIFVSKSSESKYELSRQTWWGLFLASSAMAVFSLLLVGIMILKIEAFCFFCILSAAISNTILILTLIGGGWDDFGELIFRGILVSLIIILVGLLWSSSIDPERKNISITTQGFPPAVETKSTESSIALANHLKLNGAVMYNAYWCPHCHDQKEMFGKEAVSKLLLIECAKDGFNSKTSLCQKKGITRFPSWEINGKIESGIKELKELAEITGYKGPMDF